VWEWTKEVLTPEELNSMFFLAKDEEEMTAWHIAAYRCQIELLHKVWEWTKEVLKQEEVNSIFLAKYKYLRRAWQMAAEEGQIEVRVLHKLWERTKVLTQEELNSMFLAKVK